MKPHGRTRRRTRQDIEDLLGRYHRSGLNVPAFSKAEGVSDTSLYKWLRQERAETPSPALMEVKPVAGSPTGFLVETPQGYRVEMPTTFCPEALKRLLGSLPV